MPRLRAPSHNALYQRWVWLSAASSVRPYPWWCMPRRRLILFVLYWSLSVVWSDEGCIDFLYGCSSWFMEWRYKNIFLAHMRRSLSLSLFCVLFRSIHYITSAWCSSQKIAQSFLLNLYPLLCIIEWGFPYMLFSYSSVQWGSGWLCISGVCCIECERVCDAYEVWCVWSIEVTFLLRSVRCMLI